MDQHLSWNKHLKMVKQKLNRANGILAKVLLGHVPKKSSFFGKSVTFVSSLTFGPLQVWLKQLGDTFRTSGWVKRLVFSILKIPLKTNKAFRRYSHFFQSNFYDTQGFFQALCHTTVFGFQIEFLKGWRSFLMPKKLRNQQGVCRAL